LSRLEIGAVPPHCPESRLMEVSQMRSKEWYDKLALIKTNVCKICRKEKTIEEFQKRGNRYGFPLGRTSYCKKCDQNASETRRKKLAEIRELFNKENLSLGLRICRICNKKKDIRAFKTSPSNEDGFRKICSSCSKRTNPAIKERNRRYRKNHKEQWTKTNREIRIRNTERYLTSVAKKRAKERNQPFSITYKDIVIPKNCPVFGTPLVRKYYAKNGSKENSPSLDCFIPKAGYTPENVSVISFRANRIKNDASLDELKAIVSWMEKRIEGAK
jgi:hypothetical protein